MKFETYAETIAMIGGRFAGSAVYRVLGSCVAYAIVGANGRAGNVYIAPDMAEAVRQVERELLLRGTGNPGYWCVH